MFLHCLCIHCCKCMYSCLLCSCNWLKCHTCVYPQYTHLYLMREQVYVPKCHISSEVSKQIMYKHAAPLNKPTLHSLMDIPLNILVNSHEYVYNMCQYFTLQIYMHITIKCTNKKYLNYTYGYFKVKIFSNLHLR